MPSWDDDEQDMAAELADAILSKAVAFSTGGAGGEGGEAFRHLLIAQHVKIQLAYLNNPCPLSESPGRAAMALEVLAKAHATDGVRVKTAQPWHRE
jgi:hypothetical protein